MPDDDLTIEDDPSEADVAYIEERIAEYNIAASGYDDYRPLAIFVRENGTGVITAGLTGFTWGGTLKIEYLWVDERLRGQGHGARLVCAAEREAVARGCRQVTLDTHAFQAPNFYPKLGYTACGFTDDWPVGYQSTTFQKRLR